eukprot:TRINITY_DN12183_c0_g1_i2.p1 TRINITY_DN12183_c0_g1~~TRINITY_DN12183_c0_g1_i2.p1  ORF type:complete len:385 (-),score=72.19 TRINITY_DN12183_c0_g1_i2:40-1194(-)
MIRRPPRSTHCISSAASDVYKRQVQNYDQAKNVSFYVPNQQQTSSNQGFQEFREKTFQTYPCIGDLGQNDSSDTLQYSESSLLKEDIEKGKPQNYYKLINDEQLIHNVKTNQLIENFYNQDYNFTSNTNKNSKNNMQGQVIKQFISFEPQINVTNKKCKACATRVGQYSSDPNSLMNSNININQSLIKAKQFIHKKNIIEAEQLLTQLLQLKCEHSDIYYLLGECKRIQGKLKESEYFLLQALQFSLHSPYILNSLGLLYLEVENYNRATLFFKKFVETNPQDAMVHFNLGRSLVLQKNYLEGAIYFTKAIEINPAEPFYYLHRGDSYEQLGLIELASNDFKKFKLLNPQFQEQFQKQIEQALKMGQTKRSQSLEIYLKKIISF